MWGWDNTVLSYSEAELRWSNPKFWDAIPKTASNDTRLHWWSNQNRIISLKQTCVTYIMDIHWALICSNILTWLG